ncbi:MAG: aminotransferase class I/II-fold pyridoxal phosphate-dependent enzyme [Polyangia bacterium]
MTNDTDLSTRCVHAGELKDAHGAPHTPLYNTSTFRFESTAAILDVVEGRRPGSLYTRYGLNPSIQSVEAKLASLEGAEAALAFCSGMAAEAALFLTHGRKGIVCIGDAYGGTLELIEAQLPTLNIRTQLLVGSELGRLESLLREGMRLVFFETPTNPALEVFDIKAIAALAHNHGALVIVDNTFASPVNQQPLSLGADLVLHSATKYLGGHSDLTAGAIMGPKALLDPIWSWRKNLGQMPSPETCSLLARSLRTLVVRVERQNASALAVASALKEHPRVRRVLHPGLPDFPGHKLAAAQMSGFGGMLTIEINGSFEETARFVDRLKIFAIAPSLGGAESLVTQPVTTTHHGLSAAERVRRGITDSMVRLSVGLESSEDLIADLRQALD